jgi:hypothetical protein
MKIIKDRHIKNVKTKIKKKKERKDYFGALKGIGPFNPEEDRAKDRFD